MGVLQRFALVYFVVAATCSMVMLTGAEVSASQVRKYPKYFLNIKIQCKCVNFFQGGWLKHVEDILVFLF